MPPGGAERCAWSTDGRLLATAGRAYLNVYVTTLPPLCAVYGTRVVTLTSLTEATVYQCIAVGDEGDSLNKCEWIRFLVKVKMAAFGVCKMADGFKMAA